MTAQPVMDGWSSARRTLTVLAVGCTLFAILGSLVPVRPLPLSVDQALVRFAQAWTDARSIPSRADSLANVLLYLPLGALWMGTFTVDRRGRGRLLALPAVIISVSALTIALEFAQVWLPARVVSINDVIAGTIGATAGALIWIAAGQHMVEWLRAVIPAPRDRRTFDRVLLGYMTFLLVISLLPLDLTLSARTLYAKVLGGGVWLNPFAGAPRTMEGALRLLRDIALFVPAGMWLATWRTTRARPVRGAFVTLAAGGALGVSIELAQLLVISRVSATFDVLTAILGVAVGWAFATTSWRGRVGSAHDDATQMVSAPAVTATNGSIPWTSAGLRVLGSLLYGVGIVALLCEPFEVAGSKDLWRDRYRALWTVRLQTLPLTPAGLLVGLGQVVLFGVFGAILGSAARALRLPTTLRRMAFLVIVVAAMGLAATVEVVQVLLPARTPAAIDIVLAAIGASLGALMSWRSPRSPR